MRIDPKFMYCVFAHVTDMGDLHISHGHISSAFSPAFKIYGAVPFTVEIMSLHATLSEAAMADPKKTKRGSPTPVRCLDTGGVYGSASAAARACGAHAPNMATHLSGGSPRVLKGYSFERAPGYAGGFTDAPLPAIKTSTLRHIVTREEAIAARERINSK